MIEDDLRTIVESGMDGIPVYARLIPLALPECVSVQLVGGAPMTTTIRKSRHTVSLMAVSDDRAKADRIMRTARDTLVSAMPCDSEDTHFYHAQPLGEGCIEQVRPAGDGVAYISFVDLEVLASL